MQNVERLSITLPADMARLIRAKVEGGGYASNSEVIREAMRAWQEQEQLRAQRLEAARARLPRPTPKQCRPCPTRTWIAISRKTRALAGGAHDAGGSCLASSIAMPRLPTSMLFTRISNLTIRAGRRASFKTSRPTPTACIHPKLGPARDDLSPGVRILPDARPGRRRLPHHAYRDPYHACFLWRPGLRGDPAARQEADEEKVTHE